MVSFCPHLSHSSEFVIPNLSILDLEYMSPLRALSRTVCSLQFVSLAMCRPNFLRPSPVVFDKDFGDSSSEVYSSILIDFDVTFSPVKILVRVGYRTFKFILFWGVFTFQFAFKNVVTFLSSLFRIG